VRIFILLLIITIIFLCVQLEHVRKEQALQEQLIQVQDERIQFLNGLVVGELEKFFGQMQDFTLNYKWRGDV
jgi:hypothetical protein